MRFIEVLCDETVVMGMATGLSFFILYDSGMGFGYSLLAAPLGVLIVGPLIVLILFFMVMVATLLILTLDAVIEVIQAIASACRRPSPATPRRRLPG